MRCSSKPLRGNCPLSLSDESPPCHRIQLALLGLNHSIISPENSVLLHRLLTANIPFLTGVSQTCRASRIQAASKGAHGQRSQSSVRGPCAHRTQKVWCTNTAKRTRPKVVPRSWALCPAFATGLACYQEAAFCEPNSQRFWASVRASAFVGLVPTKRNRFGVLTPPSESHMPTSAGLHEQAVRYGLSAVTDPSSPDQPKPSLASSKPSSVIRRVAAVTQLPSPIEAWLQSHPS
jgi:hypothetical protein